MKKNQSHLTRTLPLLLITVILLLAGISIMPVACNNGGKKAEEKGDSLTKQDTPAKTMAFTSCRFSSYTLTAADQKKMFDITYINRIIRTMFRFSGPKGECPNTLTAYGIDENRFVLTSPAILKPIAGTEQTFNLEEKNIKDQINTRGDYKKLYNLNGQIGVVNPIGTNVFQDVILTPMQDPKTKDIYFIISLPDVKIKKEKINVEGQIVTNPSPPAPPCEGAMCDDLSQL